MATIFKLIIEDDEGKTTVYPLADGDLTIGRKDGNTIRLMERNVSRRHARLERTNGAVFIQDLDSYNGVKINGERISGKYEVKEGDLVEIGDYHLALQKSVTRSEAPEPASVGHAATGTAAVAATGGTWPQPGTVPDFQLPNELLVDAAQLDRSVRDTVIDQPVQQSVASVVAQTVDERPKPIESLGLEAHVQPATDGVLPSFPSGGAVLAPPPAAAPVPEPLPAPRIPPAETPLAPRPATELRQGPDALADVPRLICVSTSYAGQAYPLSRPELIIGRVEDNDIVIEHRSVSRNHAKILFDGRTHKIIDLQSANGILVNFEEYAMTDLRNGDLIELGHVRFRFIPANEVFRPTAEEAAEMRKAGVAPPRPMPEDADEPLDTPVSALPTDVPGFDPSQAATVTDAPLNALEAEAISTPVVDPSPEPSPSSQAPTARPNNRGATGGAPEEDRATELNRIPASMSASVPAPTAGPVEPHAALVRQVTALDPPPSSKRRRTLPTLAAIAFLAAAVFAGVVLMFEMLGSSETDLDFELKSLFEEKRYTEVAALCADNAGRFTDAAEATTLCTEARELLRQADTTPMDLEAFPEPEIEAPPEAAPEPEITEPAPLEPPPPPPPPPVAQASAAAKRRAARRAAAARKAAMVRALVERGKRLVINGDFARAERTLKECLRLEPNQPDCHRNLGVLYAQQDQTTSAIKHYRRYVELRPDAGDAGRVRQILQKFEGSP